MQDPELEAAALRMFPSMAKPSEEPTAEPTPPTEQVEEAKLVPVPAEVMAERLKDHQRRQYSPQGVYGASLPHAMLDDVQDLPKETKVLVVEELREMAADLGATTQDVVEFRSTINSITTVPTTEQRTHWHEQSVERLNAEFGNKAASALRDAQKFISRDPRLVAMLNANNVGDHPDVVMKFARLAAEARAKGKLK